MEPTIKGAEMNCCDEYGNCRQGRDCPVRTTKTIRVRDYLAAIAIGAVFAVILANSWVLK